MKVDEVKMNFILIEIIKNIYIAVLFQMIPSDCSQSIVIGFRRGEGLLYCFSICS